MALGAGMDHWVFFSFADVSTAEKKYFVVPEACELADIWTCLEGAITTGDATITVKDDVGNTTATLTVANAGSAAGDIDHAQPSSNNIFKGGERISVETNGGSTVAQSLGVTLRFKRGSHGG